MEPPTEFTADSVRDYILSKGGKVTNHELVKHFKPFLTDPVMKDTARTQFKEYVNMLASIKLEDGEKYLVLKKKYRQGLLAEVLSDVGSEYSYVSQSTTGSTPDPPDLGLPPPRAPPPYRPPPPAPVPAPFPGPAPYQPPGAYSPTYRAVPAPGGPPPGPPGPYGGPPPGPYVGPPSPATSRNSMTMERSPALDEYYHVPESRPLADPQPVGLPPAPPPELWARSAPRRPAEQPPTRRQAPLPTPPPPPAEPAEWRPVPPMERPTPPMERAAPPMDRPTPPTDLPVERRPPPASEPSPDRPSPMDGEPAPPVPPRRRSMGKENQTPPPADAASSAEAEAARESAAEEERQKKISVKEQTQKFNRIASESQILQPKQLNKRRDRGDKTPVDDEDTSSTATFEGINKDWLLVSSSCKYMEIVRMLKDNPKLAKHKDFITGYTALHWAAKNGNLDVIKLIAGTHGVDVDSASHGGYTPLHVAMQYGHEDVFDLLVHTYGADPNVRDHSGKKPRQYMIREETTLSSEAFRSKYGAPPSPLVPPTPPPALSSPALPPVLPPVLRPVPRPAPVPYRQPGPQPLPAPPPPGYLEARRRRHQGGGVVLLARPRRLERDGRDEQSAELEPAPRPRSSSAGGKAALGWKGRLRESFRGGSRARTAPQRASLPPPDELVEMQE